MHLQNNCDCIVNSVNIQYKKAIKIRNINYLIFQINSAKHFYFA